MVLRNVLLDRACEKWRKKQMLFVKSGYRTYLLSFLVLAAAVVLQGHAQGFYTLGPRTRVTLMYALTILVPLVPVYLRKAITNLDTRKPNRRK
jgi:hypothetical protein